MSKEKEYYPGIQHQELFDHMSSEHGLTLLASEMDLIIDICSRVKNKRRSFVQKKREVSMKWWREISLEEKAIQARPFYPARGLDTLTGREIQNIFENRITKSKT